MRGIQSLSWRSRDAELPWDGLADCPGDSQISFVVFFPSGTSAKDTPHTMAFLFPGFLPLPPWQSSSFICVSKSKQSTSLLRRWSGLSEKLTQDILEPRPREEERAPQQTAQKSFLWQTPLCPSGQQEGLKSTAMSRHRPGGQTAANCSRGISHGAGAAEKCCLLHSNCSAS